MNEDPKNYCNHCICKTCRIAEVNGGAPGCGDCFECTEENYKWRCTNCNEYYNPLPCSNANLDYFIRKKAEKTKQTEAEVWRDFFKDMIKEESNELNLE